jgi:hypothetical protein
MFAISRSARQRCPAAPILYIIQAEPMACAIRNTPEIHGIKLPDCEGQPIKEGANKKRYHFENYSWVGTDT